LERRGVEPHAVRGTGIALFAPGNEDHTESHRSGFPGPSRLQPTRFEDFPNFMQGVKKVILLDDQRFTGRQSSLALQRNGSQP
jgi:hypothetical protein